MSPLFRRRRDADDDLEDLEVDEHSDDSDDAEPDGAPTVAEPTAERPRGPWDIDDVPADEVIRVDLGGMLVPVVGDIELRVEVQENVVMGATLVRGESALQIHAFAAPRTAGIWAEVAEELGESIRTSGGTVEGGTGRFGAELVARVPGPDGAAQPIRFMGVDGPRWFLRGLISGPAASQRDQAVQLEDLFAQVVVNRGEEAMAPRDQLPLRLPRDIEAQATADAGDPAGGDAATPDLDPFVRGPEITELR